MQANSIICSGTSRFLNDTYTTNLHTNRLDVTTGSNYLSSLTPYVWTIYSKREEPLLYLTQADSNGTVTDQLHITKDDIYVQCGWNGTSTSLQTAMEIVGNTVCQTALGSDNSIYPIIFSENNNTGATTHTGSTKIDQYLHYTKSNSGHLYVGDVTQQSTTVGLTNVGHNSIEIFTPKQTKVVKTTLSPTSISLNWGGSSPSAVSLTQSSDSNNVGYIGLLTSDKATSGIEFKYQPNPQYYGRIHYGENGLQIQNTYLILLDGYSVAGRTTTGVGSYSLDGTAWNVMKASAFNVQSSRVVKENIKDITIADAKKILDLRPCTFDFKIGNEKNCAGMIAEEVMDVYPHLVSVPDNYNEEEAIEKTAKGELAQVPSLDYSKFVPYLIKLVQEQQKEIDELKANINQ